MRFSKIQHNRPGFILVLTITAIGALMILLVGVLSLVRLERNTARAYSDGVQADLALAAGLEEARLRVQILARDDFFVIHPGSQEVEDSVKPVFFASGLNSSKSGWRHVPMASGLASEEGGGLDFVQPATPDGLESFMGIPEVASSAPQAKWVSYETDAQGRQWRYAYWIEGLNGYLDGDLAGLESRDLGLDGRELDWFSFFDSKTSQKPPNGPGEKLSENRNKLMSAGNIGLVLSQEEAEKVAPYVVFGLPETYERAVIPTGHGYVKTGEPAMELNKAVDNREIDGIAAHIDTYLPTFKERKGGFPATEDYLKTLAASIIDYADADSEVTRGAGYRGVDSYPFVNEIFDKYVWRDGGALNKPEIEVRTFVELWNPTGAEVTGKARLKNLNLHELEKPGGGGTEEFGEVDMAEQNVTIAANGYAVLEFLKSATPGDYVIYKKNFSFDPPMSSGAKPKPNYLFEQTFDSSYKLYWNGVEVDWARGGLERTDGTLQQGDSQRKWKGQASVALQMDASAYDKDDVPNVGRQLGDPRASTYIDTTIFANTFNDNSNFGGRAYKENINNSNYNEVNFIEWPDGGHGTGDDGTRGEKLTNAKIPTRDAVLIDEPEFAPTHISNAGRYHSLGELGNIFDPAQWRDITVTGGKGPESRAGGGATLAVGRGEFAAFDKDGWRGAELLDLFWLKAEKGMGGPDNLRILKGKVNINTAPREVLRALFAGILLDEDPGEGVDYGLPKSTLEAATADVIVEAIIAQRKVVPFMSLADLAGLKNEKGAVFGNEKQWGVGAPSADWDDQGRESLFAKVANLVAFRSRCFRVYVTGQLLDPEGKVLGSRSAVKAFSLEPARAADGSILPNEAPSVTYFYERAL